MIIILRDLFCELCRHECKLIAQVQVVLNCIGISRQVKVKLHGKTCQRLIFSQLEKCVSVFDFVSLNLINKEIASCLCFVENVNDSEIFASEVVLDQIDSPFV
jgi:hypothetical protein